MKSIKVNGTNRETLVDDEDFEALRLFNWIEHKGYVVRYKDTLEYWMHHDIIGKHDTLDVDHIDRDKFNNRRSNLRFITRGANTQNARMKGNNTSGYRGVSYRKDNGMWTAYITFEKKRWHLGLYNTLEEAARVYDRHALRYYGINASFNFRADVL